MSENRLLQQFDYDRMEFALMGYFRAHEYWEGLDALEFAKKQHYGKTRKASDLKYVCHPIFCHNLNPLYRKVMPTVNVQVFRILKHRAQRLSICP